MFPKTANIPYHKLHRFPEWTSPGLWKCDGQEAVVVADGCPYGTSFSIQCPQSKVEGVENVTIHNISYYVGAHVRCERDYPLKSPPPGTKLVGTAMLFGDTARNPRVAIEWIEYHRLLGYGHFYLYYMGFNDTEATQLYPDLPYVTYVPYQVMGKHYPVLRDNFMYQTVQHLDALYRARADQADWISFADLDEYLAVVNSSAMTRFDPDSFSQGSNQVGSLSLSTWTFGNSNDEKMRLKSDPELVIDYIWRASRPYPPPVRSKGILRVDYADYYYIHFMTLGGPTKTIDPNIVRFNHYKAPFKGVFLDRPLGNNTKIVTDCSLRDEYHSLVAKRVNQVFLILGK